MTEPSPARLNWLAENMTQVARPVNVMGIMAARIWKKPMELKAPDFLNRGPTSM